VSVHVAELTEAGRRATRCWVIQRDAGRDEIMRPPLCVLLAVNVAVRMEGGPVRLNGPSV
jgi:hypothetical protein